MKSFISLLMAAALLAGLAACGSKGPLVLPESKSAHDPASVSKIHK